MTLTKAQLVEALDMRDRLAQTIQQGAGLLGAVGARDAAELAIRRGQADVESLATPPDDGIVEPDLE